MTPRRITTVVAAVCIAVAGGADSARAENRSVDGSGNNLTHGTWGQTNELLIRNAPEAYSAGNGLARDTGPNVRSVSNAIVAQDTSITSSFGLSNMVWVWGQFVDHDLDLTTGGAEFEPIAVLDAGDPFGQGNIIPFSRSTNDSGTPRQHPNQITAYLDASTVYGSDALRATNLRDPAGGGKLRSSAGNMLPLNTFGEENANDAHIVADNQLYLAGDVRANENAWLTAMHTVWMREHNRIADQYRTANGLDPVADDEQIYQYARRMVIGQIQNITYSQWLPMLIGKEGDSGLTSYRGYNGAVNAQIATEFSTVGYRVGHTMLPDSMPLINPDGTHVGYQSLANAFFDPSVVADSGDVAALLYGAAYTMQQKIDHKVNDAVRNMLFGAPGAGGLDLASLNMQRGRDHGIANYNDLRVAYGLVPLTIAQMTDDVDLQVALTALYGSADNLDPWLGGLVEKNMPGLPLSELFHAIITEQFQRTRDGDRFWFETDAMLSEDDLAWIYSRSLSDVIMDSTDTFQMTSSAFLIPTPTTACLMLFGAAGAMLRRTGPQRRAA